MLVHDVSDIWLEVNGCHLENNNSAMSCFSLSAHRKNYLWVIWQGPLSWKYPKSKKVQAPRPFGIQPLGVCFALWAVWVRGCSGGGGGWAPGSCMPLPTRGVIWDSHKRNQGKVYRGKTWKFLLPGSSELDSSLCYLSQWRAACWMPLVPLALGNANWCLENSIPFVRDKEGLECFEMGNTETNSFLFLHHINCEEQRHGRAIPPSRCSHQLLLVWGCARMIP